MPSPNAKKKATSAKGWKKANTNEPIELPSGNVALLKPPSIPELLADGLLPESLSAIAQKHVTAGRGGKVPSDKSIEKSFEKVMGDRDGITAMFTAVARITAASVVEPEVVFHQVETEQGSGIWEDIPQEERDEEALYTDEVDFQDQLFIFNVVMGGSKDLESFRKSTGFDLAGMAEQ